MDTSLLTNQETAEMLRVPTATLDAWRYRRVGPAYIRVGRYVRYRLSDVEAWLDHQRTAGGHDAA